MHKKSINILLVDDDPVDRRLTKMSLAKPRQPVKFAVQTARSLNECLDRLKNNSFDLVLLDLALPDSQGLATVDSVYELCQHTPIVVLTGLADEEAGVEAIKRGASDYLVKSKFFRDLLVRTIRYSLERKRAEENLEKLNRELEATVEKLAVSNRELQDFAYVIAHDLKSPLRAIGTLADWISTDYSDKFDEQGQEQVKLLAARAERMSRLIDGILKYSEVGRTRQQVEEVDLNMLLAEIICEIAPPENIEIAVVGELPTITYERIRMLQVFQNLLSNAVRYMDKPTGKIKVGCTEEDGSWKFSVSDNGPGIEERYFEKIFKMFQTLLPRDEVEATGIGLSMVKKIIETYGGRIWVESEVGSGTTFFFTLPKQYKETVNAQPQANTAG